MKTENQVFDPVTSDVNFPEQEKSILKFWDDNRIFEKSMEQGDKVYSFYDGPPFATGLPHYGHILAGSIKDIVPRYWSMKGYKISRRFGWDCHGLPVEYEINKKLNIKTRQEVLDMGIAKYNAECRSIVQRYSNEWKATVRRIGRWVDMDNAYFTMDVSFMQSVWWVFSEMYKKGLIYEGYKVVPYSTGISTTLSNFEAGLNYKDVQDPALTVAFKALDRANTYFLAWTTTPWTLPSNLALAVGKDIDYVLLHNAENGKDYYMAEALVESIFKDKEKISIIEHKKGSELIGMKYEPLFNYFVSKVKDAWRVIEADHVTTDSGSGIVHMAPAFGEEDYYACQKAGIPIVNPVDDDGLFTAEVPDYKGRLVKDADKDIIARLKEEGKVVKHDTIVHSYPYCWRSNTPLIYRAVSSWFVAVEQIKERLVKNNKTTNWVPDTLRDGRFGNWLESARDWAISRNRFWGTPIPIWRNKEGEIICIGSKDELEKLSGRTVTDLHMDFIDDIEIPSPTGKSPLHRIPDVLDCWFESGSMPYAQLGYPFTNKEQFEKSFPADFIAEGLDQTRGWFYTLTVIASALFDKPPFRNVVVNGLILAEDGKKMSKSLRNYPDPTILLDTHGADALRMYMIDSPVIKAAELRFSEAGVREVVRKTFLRWWNAYSFFVNYSNIDKFEPKGDFKKTPNILDKWILSRLNHLIKTVNVEMEAYRLYNIVPAIDAFIEDLTNTYIRFNRQHFWQEGMPEDKRLAYETLYHVLISLSKIAAPFAPFLSEVTYLNLAKALPNRKESVHLDSFPEIDTDLMDADIEEAVKVMGEVTLLARTFREKIKVRTKVPLRTMKIIHRDKKILEGLKPFEKYIKEEINIREVEYVSSEDDFINIFAKANFVSLGKRVGPKMKAISAAIQKLTVGDLIRLEKGDSLTIEDETITLNDVEVRRAAKDTYPNLSCSNIVSIDIDTTIDQEQMLEGFAREIIRKVQQSRKNAGFNLDDRIKLEISCTDTLADAVKCHEKLICSETLTTTFALTDAPRGEFTETVEVDGQNIVIAVARLSV